MTTLEEMRRMLRAGTSSVIKQKKNRDENDLDFVRFEPDMTPSITQPKASKTVATIRRFECVNSPINIRKFWEIRFWKSNWEPENVTMQCGIEFRWGRIGTTGQGVTRVFPDAKAAQAHINQKIREKFKKGYREVQSPTANSS